MKKFISIAVIIALSFTLLGQTNEPPPVPPSPFMVDTNAPAFTNLLGPHVGQVVNFFSQTGTNWSVAPFVTYISDEKDIGGGIAALYSISDYAGAFLRIDYFDDQVFMPSGNFQLQLPITLAGKFQVVPFAFTGAASSLNTGESDGELIGLLGTGLGLRVTDRVGVVYDVEHWTSHPGLQHRFGVLFRF